MPLQSGHLESNAFAMTFIQAQYSTALGTCKYVVGTYAHMTVHLLTDALRAANWRQVHCKVKPRFHTSRSKNAQSQTGKHTHHSSFLSFSLTHSHTHCNGLSSVLSVPTLCWVDRSFSRGLCGVGTPHTLRGSMPGGDKALDVAMEVKELGSNPLTVLRLPHGHTQY